MKKTSMMALTALCLALPASGMAQETHSFLSAIGEGVSEGMALGAEKIASSMSEELGLTLEAGDTRIEDGQTLTLTLTATNPRAAATPVTFALSLPQRLACAQETTFDAVLPPAETGEDGTLTPSVTTFTREVTLVPGGTSESAAITCEMSMGTRFYRAQQTIDLCVADVSVTAAMEGGENGRLMPGDAFTWRIEVTNAGMAAKDVELLLTLPQGVSLTGELADGFAKVGSRVRGTVHAEAAQTDETGAAASLAVVELPAQIDADTLEGDEDATRLMAGTLYADGARVPLPRIQVCGPKISAQLLSEEDELEAGETSTLRVMVVNEGLAGADVRLTCVLPEGLELVETEQKPAARGATPDETVGALPPEDGDAVGQEVPAMAAGTASQPERVMAKDGSIVYTWHMDGAKETEDGVTANTEVFELPVRALEPQKKLKERLVGATLCYSVDGGDVTVGEALAMRVYRPTFLGIAKEDWGGIFWASLLLVITVTCLYAAVRSDSDREDYCCD